MNFLTKGKDTLMRFAFALFLGLLSVAAQAAVKIEMFSEPNYQSFSFFGPSYEESTTVYKLWRDTTDGPSVSTVEQLILPTNGIQYYQFDLFNLSVSLSIELTVAHGYVYLAHGFAGNPAGQGLDVGFSDVNDLQYGWGPRGDFENLRLDEYSSLLEPDGYLYSASWFVRLLDGGVSGSLSVSRRPDPNFATVIAGPTTNPVNGHIYYLLDQSPWIQAEAKAVAMGGHLATVRNQAEQDWIYSTFSRFGGTNRNLVIGFHDVSQFNNAEDRMQRETEFRWASGESAGYTHWAQGEPNNYRNWGEFWVHMVNPGVADLAGFWNDVWHTNANYGAPLNGVVEVIPVKPEMTIRVANVEVCWTARADRMYLVQYRSELTTNMWTDLMAAIQGTGTNNCIIDPVPRGEPQRYYRVQTVP